MNTDDLQKIAYEEIGGEEILDPSPSIIYSKLTDQEEGGFVTSRFKSAKIVAESGRRRGISPLAKIVQFHKSARILQQWRALFTYT